jgi:phosphate transport system permease protein
MATVPVGTALPTASPHPDRALDTRPSVRRRRWSRRRAANAVYWGACAAALAGVAAPVVWVLAGVVNSGLRDWHWSVLTTQTVGTGGGLLNAIAGTLVIVVGVAVIVGIVGIAGGIYLAEFCPEGRGGLLRGGSEILSGAPSIVLGYVGYVTLVVRFHWGFSLAAALAVLSVMVVPYVVKATEVSLRSVPTAYRDGSEALGMPSGYALRRVVLRPALPGIVTGLIVAMAIAVGETAPLLYTAGWSNNLPTAHLFHAPIAYLTYPVWTFYNQPYASAHRLAAVAALLLVVLALLMIVVSRIIVAVTQRHSETSSAPH